MYKSLGIIKRTIIEALENNTFYKLLEPLEPYEKESRLYESIIKQGTIIGHHPFRFYTIEIEEKKCYLITGATIKVHKDMGKADNTIIELNKLKYTLQYIKENEVDSKDVFIAQEL